MSPSVPSKPRAVAFVDGQNLYMSAKECFGYSFPNYNVLALSQAICEAKGYELAQVRFYTGIPDASDKASEHWFHFWQAKLRAMSHQGVVTYSRATRNGKEKGIDVRIAIDIISLANCKEYDVGIIFSQDQDLSEAAQEIRSIAKEQARWIKIVCAFPCSATVRNRRGIEQTDWVKIDRALYDACIDPFDYRKKPSLLTSS